MRFHVAYEISQQRKTTQSIWTPLSPSTALWRKCLSNFGVTREPLTLIPGLRYSARSGGNTSSNFMDREPWTMPTLSNTGSTAITDASIIILTIWQTWWNIHRSVIWCAIACGHISNVHTPMSCINDCCRTRLTHGYLDKMANILQTTFPNAFNTWKAIVIIIIIMVKILLLLILLIIIIIIMILLIVILIMILIIIMI